MVAIWIVWKERHFVPDLYAQTFLTLYALHGLPLEKGLYGFKYHNNRPYALIENLPTSSVFKNDFFWVSGNFDPESLSPIERGCIPRAFAKPIHTYLSFPALIFVRVVDILILDLSHVFFI